MSKEEKPIEQAPRRALDSFPTSGTFTLTAGGITSGPLPYTATEAEIVQALTDLLARARGVKEQNEYHDAPQTSSRSAMA